ncbi:MAG: FHA domain-containing protein [Lachnospiraceae bacterium]|nr:FHA domain-containing protein [Lachnospiraceae bacterium]
MAKYVTCAQGHLYDADVQAVCPICNGGGNVINFGDAPGGSDIGKTAPVGGGFGPSSPTPPAGGNQLQANMPAGDANIGETVAPGYYKSRQEEENKTVGVFSKSMKTEPTVGWLVCIEGAEQGKDYRLLAKNNTIGRSERMDVSITGDMSITRDNHARLDYDEKHNKFYLSPAENSNTIYLNEEAMYMPTQLKPYDCIELGESKLVFIPFCNENFNWKDGLANTEEEKA